MRPPRFCCPTTRKSGQITTHHRSVPPARPASLCTRYFRAPTWLDDDGFVPWFHTENHTHRNWWSTLFERLAAAAAVADSVRLLGGLALRCAAAACSTTERSTINMAAPDFSLFACSLAQCGGDFGRRTHRNASTGTATQCVCRLGRRAALRRVRSGCRCMRCRFRCHNGLYAVFWSRFWCDDSAMQKTHVIKLLIKNTENMDTHFEKPCFSIKK